MQRPMLKKLATVVTLGLVLGAMSDADAKKKKKPAPEETAPPAEEAAPPAEEAAPPADSTPASDNETPRTAPPDSEPVHKPAPESAPPAATSDWQNPVEKPNTKYLFIGLRYRGTIIPKFMVNIFADEGANVYSNSIGLELDMRHDGFSVIPSFTYTEYGMNDTLFLQKGKDPNKAADYSFINSSLKSLYLGVDVLWSTHLHKNVDLEYGLGVGVGVIFGDLVDNWVYGDPNGRFAASNGTHYSGCKTTNDGYGCSPNDHSTTDVKVNRYVEPNWFNGGPVPTFFARIAPVIGVRVKPIRDLEARIQLGFSITEGFFFGISGNYRLPYEKSTIQPAQAQ